MPGFVVATVLGAGLVSASPPQYPDGWYRLHDECESAALADIAALADADPRLVVSTGAWQSRLVLAALASDASRIWYNAGLGTRPDVAASLVQFSDDTGRPVLLVLDRRAAPAGMQPLQPPADDWRPAGAWPCAAPLTAHLHHPT